jgi:hypothetical protein
MDTPRRVKAYGKYLMFEPRPLFKVANCDLERRSSNSSFLETFSLSAYNYIIGGEGKSASESIIYTKEVGLLYNVYIF